MPEAVAAAIEVVSAAIGTEMTWTAAEIALASQAIVTVGTVAAIRNQQLRAERAARAAYDASQKDRYVMSRGSLEARQVVLGRRRTSGPMFYVGSYGDDDEHLVFTVALAGHEIDAVEAIYFDDEPVVLDGAGNVVGVLRSEQFSIDSPSDTYTIASAAKAGTVSAEAQYGSDTVTLGVSVVDTAVTVTGARSGEVGTVVLRYQPDPCPYNPTSAGMVQQTVTLSSLPTVVSLSAPYDIGTLKVVQTGQGDAGDTALDFSLSGTTVTITSGAVGYDATLTYQSTTSSPLAKVRTYLGRRDQAADSGLIAARPDHWTSAHRAAGVAYLVVELTYDRDAYSGSIPNISARVRGAKCYDPRRNLLPNPLGNGGAVGVLPTGWATAAVAGISVSVVDVGTDAATGLAAVTVRLQGTASTAGSVLVACTTNATGPSAAAGQQWSARAGTRVVGGSTPWSAFSTVQLQLLGYAGTTLAEASRALSTAEVTGVTDPVAFSGTLATAGITRAGLRWRWQCSSGLVVDTTVTLLMPQLWQGSIGSAADPTAWTQNTALQAAHYATHPLGGRLPWEQVDVAAVSSQANVCDATSTYTVGGQDYVRALYTSDYVALSTQKPTEVLTDLCTAMGGEWMYADGQLRLRAGAWRAPSFTLDESWLQGDEAVQIQAALNRDDLFNCVRGRYYDERRDYTQTDFPPIEPATYISADRAKLPLEVDYGAVSFSGQAQYVGSCALRAARQGMTVRLLCNMKAWAVEAFDTGTVNLERFGFVGKVFEVRSAGWTLDGGIELVLRETDASIWDMDAGFPEADPAPNSRLPDPWKLGALDGFNIASGNAHALKQADGTIVPRIRALWTPQTDPRVLDVGGAIELRWGLATEPVAQWQTRRVPGNDSTAYLSPVRDQRFYLVQARAVGALGTGAWTLPAMVLAEGKTVPPSNVASLSYTWEDGGARLSWPAVADADLATYEIRRGGTSWETAAFEARSAGNFLLGSLWTPTTKVWIKAIDTSGNESTTAASVTITGATARPYRIVSRSGTDTQGPMLAGLYDLRTGTEVSIFGAVRSYNVALIRRAAPYEVIDHATFDVYASTANAAAMAAYLNGAGSSVYVAVWTYSDPEANRLTGGLADAMYRCGASRAVFGSPEFKYQGAYLLVGTPGMGEGSGCEFYNGDVPSSYNAWVDAAFAVGPGGLDVYATSATPRSLRDYSYTGDLDASAGTVLVASGAASVSGSTITSTAAGGSWGTAAAYSADAYTGGAFASAVVTRNDRSMMFGLNADAAAGSGYADIDYAIYPSLDGHVYAYVSGTSAYDGGTYSAGDVLAVTYDGEHVRWMRNGSVFYTATTSAGQRLYFDAAFYSPGTLKAVQFGPLSPVTGIGTNQLLDSAATTWAMTSVDGPDDWTTTDSNHLVAGVTITNDDSVSRSCELRASLTWEFPSGIANGNMIRCWFGRSSSFSGGLPTWVDYQHTVAAGEDRRWEFTGAKVITLAPGETGTFWLVARESYFTTLVRYSNIRLRAEIVKK